jgi:preprotein translocase subunit SecA
MNKQRENIYSLRRELLEGQIRIDEDADAVDTHGYLFEVAGDVLDDAVDRFAGADADVETWDVPALRQEVTRVFALEGGGLDSSEFDRLSSAEIRDALWDRIVKSYEDKAQLLGPELMRRIERDIMLQIVDSQWKDHLYSLDHLKEGIGLRGYGQRDPLVEYKRESFGLFQDMKARVDEEMLRALWWLRPVPADGSEGGPTVAAAPARRPPSRRPPTLILNDPGASQQGGFSSGTFGGRGSAAAVAEPDLAAATNPFGPSKPRPARVGGDDTIKTVKREEPKVGRNDPCPCGSGKKYKKCHGANQ